MQHEELKKQRKAGYQRRGKEAEKRRISKYRTKKTEKDFRVKN